MRCTTEALQHVEKREIEVIKLYHEIFPQNLAI
jgi:hypothetical protein